MLTVSKLTELSHSCSIKLPMESFSVLFEKRIQENTVYKSLLFWDKNEKQNKIKIWINLLCSK